MNKDNDIRSIHEFNPMDWSDPPAVGCPVERSTELTGLRFTGVGVHYRGPDTWYPTWANDDVLYSPITDGKLYGFRFNSCQAAESGTGAARIDGDDPRNLDLSPISHHVSSAEPYIGRYPCGSLVHNGVWYYGTYAVDTVPTKNFRFPIRNKKGLPVWIARMDPQHGPSEDMNINYMGPFVGFRISENMGKSWTETPHTPGTPLFPSGDQLYSPTKIGAPHFVDFGKDMEHSPDGKAYLVAHGAIDNDPTPKDANTSWITGDAIYLLRVTPSVETINDATAYEYYGGESATGEPIWTSEYRDMKPLLEWNNHCGCTTITYNPGLSKFIMSVSYGLHTHTKFNTYIMESDRTTGPWRLVTYMRDFGEGAYFVNFPSKFVSSDGHNAWMCYSANFSPNRAQKKMEKPPGSRYGLCLQEVEFIRS